MHYNAFVLYPDLYFMLFIVTRFSAGDNLCLGYFIEGEEMTRKLEDENSKNRRI